MAEGLCAGKSDFVDALICGADTIFRTLDERPQLEAAVVKKRIVLVSNFLDAVRPSLWCLGNICTFGLVRRGDK